MNKKFIRLLAVLMTVTMTFDLTSFSTFAETGILTDESVNVVTEVGELNAAAGVDKLFEIAAESFAHVETSYVLTAEQMDEKKVLADHYQDAFSLDAGFEDVDGIYRKGEVIYLVDNENEAEKVAKTLNAKVKDFSYGVATFELPSGISVPKAIAAAANPETNIPAVWPNYISKLCDTVATDPYIYEGNSKYQWMHDYIGSKQAWAAGYKGQGIKVCVIDTGLTENHTDISANVIPGKTFVKGAEGTPNSVDLEDGHGSHVAGIIAADDNGILGCGIAPDARVCAYSVIGDEVVYHSDIMRAIRAAVEEGYDIINISLGSVYYEAPYEKVCREAREAGVPIFAAAGNESVETKLYPAAYNGCISIGSLDIHGGASDFSNRGSNVDFAFPGSSIYSLDSSDVNNYVSMSGTSMASPAAAGTAAVILSANVDGIQSKKGAAKVDALINVMKRGATQSTSDGMGAGCTYLPSALSLSESLLVVDPVKPSIDVVDELPVRKGVYRGYPLKLKLSTNKTSDSVAIYYSTDGKTPALKNGKVINYNGVISGESGAKELAGYIYAETKKVKVKAIAVDLATMKVSKASSFACTVEPYPQSVVVTSKYGTNVFKQGSKEKLSAVVYPEFCKKSSVVWELDEKAVNAGIKINSKGKLTIPNGVTGKYTVNAKAVCDGTSYGSPATFSFTVVEAPKRKQISISKNTITVNVGDSVSLNGLVMLDGKTAESGELGWTCSNKKIAGIYDGVLYPSAPGKIKATCLVNDGTTAKASITVKVVQPVTDISISGNNIVAAGKTLKLNTTVLPKNATNKKLVWETSSSDISVKNGIVDAKKAKEGIYYIYVSSADGNVSKKTFAINVTGGIVTDLKLSDTVIDLYVPGTPDEYLKQKKITANIAGGSGLALTWTSDNLSVAKVDSNGNVYAVGPGKATITCAATDGSNKKAKCSVNVNVPVSSIYVRPQYAAYFCGVLDGKFVVYNGAPLARGYSINMIARCGNSYGNPTDKRVKWSSDNPNITVDEKGKVTALTSAIAGEAATITATSYDGRRKGSSKVIVTEPVPSTAKVYYKTISYQYGGKEYKFDTFVAAPDDTDPSTFYSYCTYDASENIGLDQWEWVGVIPVNNNKNKNTGKITARMLDGSNIVLSSEEIKFVSDDE